MVVVAQGRVMIEGATDLGIFEGVDICGIDVGVAERTGPCGTTVVSACVGRADDLVGMYTGVVGSEISMLSALRIVLRVRWTKGALWMPWVVRL